MNQFARALLPGLMVLLAGASSACELCAIYNADSAMGQSGKGFSLSVSEQFIPYHTVQRDGTNLPASTYDKAFLNRSMIHIVPTWNFSRRVGISVSLPVISEEFRTLVLTPKAIETREGEETDIGDVSLVGRSEVFQAAKGNAAISLNLLAGVKFPTGDTKHLDEEVALEREWTAIAGPGHKHSVSGIHLHDLTLGTGSYDGVFGVTINSRWRRLFCNAQLQYYLRSPGESGYEFGDEWMVSGGPGLFIVLRESFTLNLQIIATHTEMQPDILLGLQNANTGLNATYLGPQLNLTCGERFSANAGVDIPIRIDNRGLQDVADYRIRAGISFRF